MLLFLCSLLTGSQPLFQKMEFWKLSSRIIKVDFIYSVSSVLLRWIQSGATSEARQVSATAGRNAADKTRRASTKRYLGWESGLGVDMVVVKSKSLWHEFHRRKNLLLQQRREDKVVCSLCPPNMQQRPVLRVRVDLCFFLSENLRDAYCC